MFNADLEMERFAKALLNGDIIKFSFDHEENSVIFLYTISGSPKQHTIVLTLKSYEFIDVSFPGVLDTVIASEELVDALTKFITNENDFISFLLQE